MAYEIELKVCLEDIEDKDNIKNKLTRKGCVWGIQKRQYDKIYSQKDYNTPQSSSPLFMRIRYENNNNILNLKQILNNTEVIEFESSVENPNAIAKMLEILGFNEYITIDKMRLKGKLDDFSICIDEVKQLGLFLEVEKIVEKTEDRDCAKKDLQNLLVSLGISLKQVCDKRYHTMLYELKQNGGT